MRTLTKRQKNYIDKLVAKRDIYFWEEFSNEEQQALTDMNDTEILWIEAQRYAGDMSSKRKYSKW